MKITFLALMIPFALSVSGNLAAAQPVSNSVAPATRSTPPTPDEKDQAGFEKHTRQILDTLKLDDAAKAARVHDLLLTQFAAWKQWHIQNDARLNELWAQYNKTRATKNQTNIDLAMSAIDAIYAGLKPQHDRFKGGLAAVLTPEQIETVEDAITINKVKITFKAYGEIFHGLSDAQQAFILEKLKAAREEAIDAGSMKEVSAFFKKYKDQIEAYLTAQGYDVKQAYRDFVARQKAEPEAKKTAAGDKQKE